MLFFGLALLIAARPDLDNPGCYRDGWDYFRAICEAISLVFFLFNLVSEIHEMIRYVYEYVVAIVSTFHCSAWYSASAWYCLNVHVRVPHSTTCNILVLQYTDIVPQGLLQLLTGPCSCPSLTDHSFSGSHHMVCLHWRWLLCGSNSHDYIQHNQSHPGHQPGLHHCIQRSVDHCLTGLHGQCHAGLGVSYSVQVHSRQLG